MFTLCYFCDEGFTGYDEVFEASSREEVAKFMTEEILSYVEAHFNTCPDHDYWDDMPKKFERGSKYFQILSSAGWGELERPFNPYSNGRNGGFEYGHLLDELTPEKLLNIMDESYVEGDSKFQINLLKVTPTVKLLGNEKTKNLQV